MERTLWTDARLDDAFENVRGDNSECLSQIRQLRRDWERAREADAQRRETERKERKKDRWAFIGTVVAAFGVLAPVIVVVTSNS